MALCKEFIQNLNKITKIILFSKKKLNLNQLSKTLLWFVLPL